jgi:hypothetical protein
MHSRVETTHLAHLRLYRDDLIEIAKALAEVGSFKGELGDWELTDPSDFESPELPDELPDVAMTGTNGTTAVAVKLGRAEASVQLTEPNTFTEGTLARIQRITKQRRRIPLGQVTPTPSTAPLRSSARLINAYRGDRPTFWQRTRDDWIIGVVMLLFGGVLGYLVNQIT